MRKSHQWKHRNECITQIIYNPFEWFHNNLNEEIDDRTNEPKKFIPFKWISNRIENSIMKWNFSCKKKMHGTCIVGLFMRGCNFSFKSNLFLINIKRVRCTYTYIDTHSTLCNEWYTVGYIGRCNITKFIRQSNDCQFGNFDTDLNH